MSHISRNEFLHTRQAKLFRERTNPSQENPVVLRPGQLSRVTQWLAARKAEAETLATRAEFTGDTAAETDSPPLRPDVSVIVSLPEHHGLALECVDSWVRGQTYPRSRFEVLVASDGSDPALEGRVKALLGPQDRLIAHPTTTLYNLYLLYNIGAREAKGALLFITESHSLPEPECLEELVTFFSTHDYDGACSGSVAICANITARMHQRLLDAEFRIWSEQGNWCKVMNNQGFAIYRDTYLEVGGFEHTYGHFAKYALGAKLHSQGYRLGYAAGAAVRHFYSSSIRGEFYHIRDFTRGECAYRKDAPVEYCDRYFGYAEDWVQRESFRPTLARSMCLAVYEALATAIPRYTEWSMVRAQANALLRLLPTALLGPRWPLIKYRWLLWSTLARCWLWRFHEDRLYRASFDAWDRVIRYSRMEFIAEHLAALPPAPPQVTELRLAEIGEEWLVGFHSIERWGDATFRWSGPVGLIRLGLPRGTYDVQIETRGVRAEPVPLHLRAFFNRRQLPSAALRWQDDRLTFRLDAAMFAEGPEQHLILICNPLRPWTVGVPDRRKLGLPIFSIAFGPIGEAISGRDELPSSTSRQVRVAHRTARDVQWLLPYLLPAVRPSNYGGSLGHGPKSI